MEEGKIVNPSKSKESKSSFENALWQWQSGPSPDPWAEKDASKWSWQSYFHDDCLIIEEAFSLGKEVADLGNFEVDLKRMLQVNKQFKNRIRRVRRQEKSRFMMEMSEPFAIMSNQKWILDSIQSFLDFLMKRTPEAYGVYQRLKGLSLESQSHEFEDIMKEVTACIEKGAEVRGEITNARSTNLLTEAEKIVDVIKMNSATLRDFLKTILRVYSMETFICYWLNELLRSENWEEINVLTPFLVCLIYTFKLSEYTIKYEEPQRLMNSLVAFVGKKRLYLYRGTALTREHLELYDPKKIEYFSWNGLTSTSRERNFAISFIRSSLEKARRLNEPKVGVLFKIEIDFGSTEDCEGVIDIFQNACSQYPDEREVILAPGIVFQLRKVRLIENDFYKVNLKVRKKFEETKESIVLLGSFQNLVILKEKVIITRLSQFKSDPKLFELLKGNKLIRNIEITNSHLDEDLLEKIDNLRKTTNVKREDVTLRSNIIKVNSLNTLAHYFSTKNLNDILNPNWIEFTERVRQSHFEDEMLEVTTLILNEIRLQRFVWENQLEELRENIINANQIVHLDFALPKVEEKSELQWIDFLACIRELKSLQNLKLKINPHCSIKREGLQVLCELIGSSKTLNQLDLELRLPDERVDTLDLKEMLEPITWIQNLSLHFKSCKRISDDELIILKRELLSISSLQHFSLDFEGCSNISDEGINNLMKDPLPPSSLKHLSLNFENCFEISDEGLDHLKGGLGSLLSLQHLSLSFQECKRISDKGLNHLKNSLGALLSLHHLSLSFQECEKISDEGLNHLKGGLVSLSALQHLSLSFQKCYRISDEGLNHLKSGLLSFSSLQHLSLDFQECEKISDEGLNHLKHGLLPLSSLQHLSLSFQGCEKISDEGLNHLKHGLLPLSSLQHLSLSFQGCEKISDEGLNHLKSGLLSLSSLQHLSLNFYSCDKISDEGLNHLKNGMLSLSLLQDLSLNFYSCNLISDGGLDHIKKTVLSLSSLQDFSLEITSEKISHHGPKKFESEMEGKLFSTDLRVRGQYNTFAAFVDIFRDHYNQK